MRELPPGAEPPPATEPSPPEPRRAPNGPVSKAWVFHDPPALAKALGGHKAGANQWMAHCPCHEDRTPSLSVRWGRNGKTIVGCKAGCRKQDVLAELSRRGISVSPQPPAPVKRPKRPVTLAKPVAVAAYTLSERRMLDVLLAEQAKMPQGPLRVTYNAFESPVSGANRSRPAFARWRPWA